MITRPAHGTAEDAAARAQPLIMDQSGPNIRAARSPMITDRRGTADGAAEPAQRLIMATRRWIRSRPRHARRDHPRRRPRPRGRRASAPSDPAPKAQPAMITDSERRPARDAAEPAQTLIMNRPRPELETARSPMITTPAHGTAEDAAEPAQTLIMDQPRPQTGDNPIDDHHVGARSRGRRSGTSRSADHGRTALHPEPNPTHSRDHPRRRPRPGGPSSIRTECHLRSEVLNKTKITDSEQKPAEDAAARAHTLIMVTRRSMRSGPDTLTP